jgi:hypothetical protein
MSVSRENDPVDPIDPAAWPAWTDDWRWVPTEPADAPETSEVSDQVEDWGDIPPRRQVSPIELSMLAAHGCI